MAKTRKLTDEEQKITRKQLQTLEFELELKKYMRRVIDTDLRYGLNLKYRKAIKEQKQALKKTMEDIDMICNNIKILNNQLKKGVEVKENGSKTAN